MTTFVVLLRGVNVGGRNRLPMADLRDALTSDGLAQVRTYIQSGNVLVDSPARSSAAVAARVRAVIARDFGLDVPAVGLSAAELTSLAAGNPFPDEPDPKRVHAIVLETPPAPAALADIEARQRASRDKGSADSVRIVDRCAWLHTPSGLGTSDLAARLTSGRGPLAAGTARNMSTVAALLDLCSH